MRTHHIALLAVACTLALTACDPQPAGTDPAPAPAAPTSATAGTAPAASAPPSSAPTPTAAQKAPPSATVSKPVPNFVGQVLQTAQDGAQAQGFFLLSSHDSLGQNRNQVLDRNWKVCSQSPAAGSKVSTDTKVDFGTVKLDEVCP